MEASGSIDEDGYERIACTELTLIKELTLKEFAGYGMMYIVQHPLRERWQQEQEMLTVKKDKAIAKEKNAVAIARGSKPKVKGAKGSILGLILEPEPGKIVAAKLFTVEAEQSNKWYTLCPDRTIQEAES